MIFALQIERREGKFRNGEVNTFKIINFYYVILCLRVDGVQPDAVD